MLAIASVLDVNEKNITYVLNGARELYERLSDRNDGRKIRFKDFIQLYISTQTDYSGQDAMVHEFNKEKEYYIVQSRNQDTTFHQHDLKKVQVEENVMYTLDYSSSSIRIFDPVYVHLIQTVTIEREKHTAAVVINDFHYSDGFLVTVLQD